ncbi:MAG: carbohydrate-binding domain-containing protein [Lachnospiraceae bacterium]|nr:carbohydrate-binding domain-containing protein [Lachnospiraceae bacterium]
MTGCGSKTDTENTTDKVEQSVENTKDTENSGVQTDSNTQVDTSDMFSDRDYKTEYDESKSAVITLTGDSATCTSDAVEINGSTVTIKDEGTYMVSGSLDNGMLIVEADDSDKLQLVLDNASIHSESSAPIYILEADKVFITLAEGSTNSLSNGGSFEAIDDNNIDGTLFSKQDLTLNGSGSLTITSPAGHGIVCKDDLVFTSGTYTIDAASHGMDVNDSVRVTDAAVTITSGKDGIHVENSDDEELGFVYAEGGTFTIDAQGDGMSAGAYMLITGGNYYIVSGGGSVNSEQKTSDSWGFMGGGMGGGRPGGGHGGRGMWEQDSQSDTSTDTEDDSTSIKGLKAAGNLTITGGNITIDSADDSIHSNMSVTINGGTFEIAAGDDALHADEILTVTDGNINISQSYEGLEGLHIVVSGGEISLVASDDGINAAGGTDQSGYGGPRGNDRFGGSSSSNGSITISGGNLFITSSGDGLDANGTLEISGGYTVVCGPTTGDTATLDYDISGVITGGTFIGTGAYQMAQTFSDSEQGVVAVSVGNQQAGTELTLKDAEGNTVVTHTPDMSYAILIYSSPEIVKGETYTLTVGSDSGEITAN